MKNCLDFYPVVKNSGFQMEGYHVWCGSVIREGGTYYLFAARWPEETGFPLGYLTDSEIVLATTDDLAKPFQFQKVLFGKREAKYWDSVMAHNPFIFKVDDLYVLYYIGSPDGGCENRAIGYAWSKSLTDGWTRSDAPIALPKDANNPAIFKNDDGSFFLYFRDGHGRVSVARSDSFRGPFKVENFNLFPSSCCEDMFVYKDEKGYVMIAEDGRGYYTGLEKGGVRFRSEDGIHWDEDSAEPAFDFDLQYDDGTHMVLQRRERPFLFWDGDRKYLISTAKIGGPDQICGGKNWNMIQEIKEIL
ncbi:MAG: glycoside hydrolase family protein [Clostridia bacterium]|nr:glycoside hydrolase family protein [Clostridia bacterium]